MRPEPTYVNFLPSGKTLDPNPTNEQQDLKEEIQQNAGMVLQTTKPASQDLDQTGIDWPNLKDLSDIPSDMIIEDLSCQSGCQMHRIDERITGKDWKVQRVERGWITLDEHRRRDVPHCRVWVVNV